MHKVRSLFQGVSLRVGLAVFAALTALMAFAGPALATESATETKLKTVAEQVGSEGVSIVLVILGAITALIVAIIVIPKAVSLIKRFI
jgi:hypothetical protein